MTGLAPSAPTPSLWPAEGVFFARVDEDIVVLDVRTDAYACLVDASSWLDLGEDAALLTTDASAAAELVAAGLAVGSRPGTPRRPPTPARRCWNEAGAASLLDRARAAIALTLSTPGFKRRAFPDLIAHARTRGAPADAPDAAAVETALAAWRAVLPWIPGEGECLQRAWLLRVWLGANGIRADWIFGVRTWPFGAHCWLQIGDAVVGDTLERVGNYTPLMVV
ncbi:MAG: lasso peptide biosynthesis B2 protein [Caulobacteraceae bacterium]|nr:lasso peptide biosynthesis B2 protein [Caulobacteraceae bacterium]